jgi:hypothetical protein
VNDSAASQDAWLWDADVIGDRGERVSHLRQDYVYFGADLGSELKAPLSAGSFVIEPGTIEDMYQKFTHTAILVARRPRAERALPDPGAPLRFVDDSFTRPPGAITASLRERSAPYFQAAGGPRAEGGTPGPTVPRQQPPTLFQRLLARMKGWADTTS